MDFKPIGRVVSSWFKDKNGTPRQPSLCRESQAVIDLSGEMTRNFPKINNVGHSLENLDEFSHVWLLFVFHKSLNNGDGGGEGFSKAKVAPPRLNGKRVGVFATRSPHRPNLIGLTLAKLEAVRGHQVHVSGIDLILDTPILDIKPYIPAYDKPPEKQKNDDSDAVSRENEPVKISPWICGGENSSSSSNVKKADDDDDSSSCSKQTGFIMSFSEPALQSVMRCVDDDVTKAESLKKAVAAILIEDPRSVYRKDKCADKLYFFVVNNYHVTAWFDDEDSVIQVLKVKKQQQQ